MMPFKMRCFKYGPRVYKSRRSWGPQHRIWRRGRRIKIVSLYTLFIYLMCWRALQSRSGEVDTWRHQHPQWGLSARQLFDSWKRTSQRVRSVECSRGIFHLLERIHAWNPWVKEEVSTPFLRLGSGCLAAASMPSLAAFEPVPALAVLPRKSTLVLSRERGGRRC